MPREFIFHGDAGMLPQKMCCPWKLKNKPHITSPLPGKIFPLQHSRRDSFQSNPLSTSKPHRVRSFLYICFCNFFIHNFNCTWDGYSFSYMVFAQFVNTTLSINFADWGWLKTFLFRKKFSSSFLLSFLPQNSFCFSHIYGSRPRIYRLFSV